MISNRSDVADLLGPIRRIHERVRDVVVTECERAALEQLADVVDDETEGDTIYAIDRVSEDLLVELFANEIATHSPIVLIAEGLAGGKIVLPIGATENDAVWRVIVDPIDGTRGLMYQKRSAWILTGVAPNRGDGTNLQDIELAVQTEIPLVKQHLCDELWAIRDQGAHAERFNRLTQQPKPLPLRPSRATTIRHGFAMIARFFPGARDELAAIDEEIVRGALGPVEPGKAHCFEDQYLSSGGQLYELMMGHDRFVADLRPLIESVLRRRGLALGICCHPYDVCTELIAREAGVVVTDERGARLSAPLCIEPEIAWAGYANDAIRQEIEPLLRRALTERGLDGNAHVLSDVSRFLDTLATLEDHLLADLRTFFEPHLNVTIARAPGRLDVMGGIADYSGSLVLELPIAEATLVALQKDNARRIRVISVADNETRVLRFEMPLAQLKRDGAPIEYEELRKYFASDKTHAWAAYVVGVFLVLARERGIRFEDGARLLISSRVPEGKGVSSSAALEVATMSAVTAAFGINVGPREIALLCQRVENLVVGAPCGVMDQMTAACGEANQLLSLVCQPAELLGSIKLPEGLGLWGLDSGTRHSIGGGDYGSVRAGTFMGYRIIADVAGFNVDQNGARVVIHDPRWRGYLANLSPAEFEQKFAAHLPESMLGDDFLSRYGGTTDAVTTVEADRTYAIRAPTIHAIYESARVRQFAELLQQRARLSQDDKITLGRLMYESHASYSACGLGSQTTDLLVEMVRATGVDQGLFGAKITGGGSGGTVAVLGNRDAETAVKNVADSYAALTGYQPYIFRGSSPGSAEFGHLVAGVK